MGIDHVLNEGDQIFGRNMISTSLGRNSYKFTSHIMVRIYQSKRKSTLITSAIRKKTTVLTLSKNRETRSFRRDHSDYPRQPKTMETSNTTADRKPVKQIKNQTIDRVDKSSHLITDLCDRMKLNARRSMAG